MRNLHTRSAVTILQAVLLMTAIVALLQQRSDAAGAPVSLAAPSMTSQTNKGFVVAKAEGYLTIREAGSTVQIAVNKNTQVLGQRGSFQDIAINDLVRIEGRTAADRTVTAARIEVLLAADSLSAGQRTKAGSQNWWLSVIMNGGIVVHLP